MNPRLALLAVALPAAVLATAVACSHRDDHPPLADPGGGDALFIDRIDHYPEVHVDSRGAETASADTAPDTAALDSDAGALDAPPGDALDAPAEVDPDVGTDGAADGVSDGVADGATDAGADADAVTLVDECGPALTTATASGVCPATVQSWPSEGGGHVDPSTTIVYCTTPPNSGPHYPIWAAFRSYDRPIAAGYLGHDLEHGAVVVHYRCATSCPDIAAQLQAIIDKRPVDPACNAEAGVLRRVILVPDPALDVLVGVGAWGWTYRADCVDEPSLGAFIDLHYAGGPENFCADGVVPP